MTNEERELADGLFDVLADLQRSEFLFRASRTMEIDEDDKESADALLSIFGERIEGEIKRLEEVYDALHAFFVDGVKVGF